MGKTVIKINFEQGSLIRRLLLDYHNKSGVYQERTYRLIEKTGKTKMKLDDQELLFLRRLVNKHRNELLSERRTDPLTDECMRKLVAEAYTR